MDEEFSTDKFFEDIADKLQSKFGQSRQPNPLAKNNN